MAIPNVNAIQASPEQQLLARPETKIRESIRWTRVIKLPALLLLVMVLLGLVVAKHTLYVEAQSDRLIADTDQFVTDALESPTMANADTR